jgi:hypothetical protein
MKIKGVRTATFHGTSSFENTRRILKVGVHMNLEFLSFLP